MEAIANALLERETLDRDDIDLLADGQPLPPVKSSSDEESGDRPADGSESGSRDSTSDVEASAAPALFDSGEQSAEGGDR